MSATATSAPMARARSAACRRRASTSSPSEGLRLTQYLVEPACTPSRAALMTGRYSLRSGLSTVIVGGTPNTLQDSEVTLGGAVQEPGLRHRHRRQVASRRERAELADPPGLRRVPRRRLRDHRRHPVSREHAARRHARGGHRRGRALHLGIRRRRQSEEGAALHGGVSPAGRRRHRRGGGRASSSARPRPKQPFFLYVGFTHTHYPTLAAPEFAGKSRIGVYGDAIMELDHRTGQVLDAIEAAGIEDNTIVSGSRTTRPPRRRARSTRAPASTARSAASSATRWRARSAPSA